MNETLDPLSGREQRVLDLARSFEPPAGAEDRVFSALQASMASLPVEAGPGLTKAFTAKTVAAIGAAMLMVGAVAGPTLGRTVFAPPPQILERVMRAEAAGVTATPPPPEVEAPPPAVPLTPPPRKTGAPVRLEPKPARAPAAAPAVADALLAKELELIDTARSALLHADASAALLALQAHAAGFPSGRLTEERESLWVQALVMNGSLEAAKARAAQFHQKYPRSLLGPTVDAAIGEP